MRWHQFDGRDSGNRPAFPVAGAAPCTEPGMSKRELVAAILALGTHTDELHGQITTRPLLAGECVAQADALLEALQAPSQARARQRLIDIGLLMYQELEELVEEARRDANDPSALDTLGELLIEWRREYAESGLTADDHFRGARERAASLAPHDE